MGMLFNLFIAVCAVAGTVIGAVALYILVAIGLMWNTTMSKKEFDDENRNEGRTQ
jgi:uncharacterized membrane protein YqjE